MSYDNTDSGYEPDPWDPQSDNPFASPAHEAGIPQAFPLEENLRKRLRGTVLAPGAAMIIVGAVGLVFMLVMGGVMVLDSADEDFDIGPAEAVIIAVPLLLWLTVNVLTLLGGISMVRFRSWGWSLAGAIACLVGCFSLGLINLAVGIWALVVLTGPQVRRAFAQADSSEGT